MFDSQFCSLASLTFLVQILGLSIAVIFRLRCESSVANWCGLLLGVSIMAVSAMICLVIDPSSGIMQGVAVVSVAIGTTLSFGESRTSGI